MTAWTPDIQVRVLGAGVPHTETPVVLEGWIDYSISATRGSSDYITPPYPASTVVTLLFDNNSIPEIELGSWLEIAVYDPTTSIYTTIHSGNVTDVTSNYRTYGLSGFILEWQLSVTSAISALQNMVWYNETNFTGNADECVVKVTTDYGRALWNQINATTAWNAIGPSTWEEFDDAALALLPAIGQSNFDTSSQRLNAGYRNVWDDLVTLTYGVYGFIYEDAGGQINLSDSSAALIDNLTLTQDMLNTDIQGGFSINELRNVVTITEFDEVASTYYDHESISLYGQRLGTLNTYLTETLEAANVGEKVVAGLAYPLLCTKQVSVNLLNPIFSDADRGKLLFSPLGRIVSIEAPSPMGGTLDYITIGCQFEITKDAFILGLTLTPLSQVVNSLNWDQIPYNYTWTSYGVAFPTQEWQDL